MPSLSHSTIEPAYSPEGSLRTIGGAISNGYGDGLIYSFNSSSGTDWWHGASLYHVNFLSDQGSMLSTGSGSSATSSKVPDITSPLPVAKAASRCMLFTGSPAGAWKGAYIW